MKEAVGRIVSVNLSGSKAVRKVPGDAGTLVPEHGLQGDAHAGAWHRQVSLLAEESVDRMRGRGMELNPGDFAENLTVAGLDLRALQVGDRLMIGASLLEITQIGKECHRHCAIYRAVGDCVMPREGVFARVLRGGMVHKGDAVETASSGGECNHE